jgi:hypothetical protein
VMVSQLKSFQNGFHKWNQALRARSSQIAF